MRKTAYLTMVVALLLGAAVSGWAQESGSPQEPPDLVAYRPIYDPATPAPTKIYMSEAFLAETRPEFLDSTYRDYVFVILYRTYKEEKSWLKALDTVDRLEKLVPKTSVERRLSYYDEAMRIANTNINPKDTSRTIEYAEKIIALEPNNVPALLTLATAIPALPNDPAAQEPILMKVVGYGRKVLTLDKPASVPDDLWKDNLKTIRVLTLDLVARIQLTIKKDYVECIKAYDELLRMTPKDAAALYRLGICHYYLVQDSNKLYADKVDELREFTKKCNEEQNCGVPDKEKASREIDDKVAVLKKDFEQKREKAIDAFARSVAIGGTGPEPAAARFELEKLYKTIVDPPPPMALDDFIAQKKRELGV